MTPIPDPDPTPRDRAEQFIEDKASRLADRPLKLRAEATKILTALGKKDPTAWNDFVNDVAVEAVVSRLRSHLARERHAAVTAERRSVFGRLHDDTVTAIESGESLPSPFDARYSLPGKHNDWFRLGDMTRPDLLAVSQHRAKLSRSNGIEAIFLATLAARLPDDTTTVAEALTEDDVLSVHDKAESSDLGDLPDTETE